MTSLSSVAGVADEDEARAGAMWYWLPKMAARFSKVEGFVRHKVITPSACRDAYAESMFFELPWLTMSEIAEKLNFERALGAYCLLRATWHLALGEIK